MKKIILLSLFLIPSIMIFGQDKKQDVITLSVNYIKKCTKAVSNVEFQSNVIIPTLTATKIISDTSNVGNDTITGGLDLTDLANIDISNISTPLQTIYTQHANLSIHTGTITAIPTATEITNIVGSTAAASGAGFMIIIKGNAGSGSGYTYIVHSDGTDWFWMITTKAL